MSTVSMANKLHFKLRHALCVCENNKGKSGLPRELVTKSQALSHHFTPLICIIIIASVPVALILYYYFPHNVAIVTMSFCHN